MNNLEKVKEFHTLTDGPLLSITDDIDIKRRILRLSLALEELDELAEAFGLDATFGKMMVDKTTSKLRRDTLELNKVEVLDALCDIEYINNGTVLECGVEKVYNQAFDDVHQSNMSKACDTIHIASQTTEDYHNKGVTCYFMPKGDKYLVYRASDNKVLKSINYKKVELNKYFDAVND